MANILDQAVTDTLVIGGGEGGAFHIALTGTADYIPHLGVVMMSAAAANPDLAMTFHFFVNRLPERERAKLTAAAAETGRLIEVHLIDDRCFAPILLSDGQAAFFYRFVVAPTLWDRTDRVLYLDGDMMVHGDLSPLATLDFEEKAAAVVTDRREDVRRKRVGTARYFNAGMMLLNLPVWRAAGYYDDIVRRAKVHAEHEERRISSHDQDIHNQMLDGHLLFIDRRYNYLYDLDRRGLFQKQPENADWKDQVVLHFAGHSKPWHSWVQHWPAVAAYRTIAAASPWRDAPLVPPKGAKNLHQAARTALMRHRWGELLHWWRLYMQAKL